MKIQLVTQLLTDYQTNARPGTKTRESLHSLDTILEKRTENYITPTSGKPFQ